MAITAYSALSTFSSNDVFDYNDANQIKQDFDHLKEIQESTTVVVNEVASGASGGSASLTTWETRPISAIDAGNVNSEISINTGTDRITIPAGVWEYHISASIYYTGQTILRLYNATNATTLEVGESTQPGGSEPDAVHMHGIFTITGTKEIAIQQYSSRAQATNGMGNPTSAGTNERYLTAMFRCLDNA